eukprot:SAG11_NODE_5276_length_1608_cov_1.206097_1_plen_105_part_00
MRLSPHATLANLRGTEGRAAHLGALARRTSGLAGCDPLGDWWGQLCAIVRAMAISRNRGSMLRRVAGWAGGLAAEDAAEMSRAEFRVFNGKKCVIFVLSWQAPG